MAERDVEKMYSAADSAAKLRRLADALESGKRFRISVAGERINVPKRAEFSVEHEREGDTEEVEFQLKWSIADAEGDTEGDDDGDEAPEV